MRKRENEMLSFSAQSHQSHLQVEVKTRWEKSQVESIEFKLNFFFSSYLLSGTNVTTFKNIVAAKMEFSI
jgi:hypothetical protein